MKGHSRSMAKPGINTGTQTAQFNMWFTTQTRENIKMAGPSGTDFILATIRLKNSKSNTF